MKTPTFLKKLKSKLRLSGATDEQRFGLRNNLKRDWKILLISFALLNVLVLVLNTIFFLRITSRAGLAYQPEDTLNLETIERNALNELLKSLEIRDSEFERIIKSPPKTFDPSL